MVLAPLVAPLWKDVPAGIRRYGAAERRVYRAASPKFLQLEHR